MNLIEQILRSALAPPSDLPNWQWMEKHIVLDNTGPLPGPFSTSLTPFVRHLYGWRQNPRIKRVVAVVSAQSGKTQTAINLLLHDISQDPGPTMVVSATKESVEEFAQKRLFTAVEDCPMTAPLLPTERNRRSKRLIQFSTMNLMLRGANSNIGLKSDPVRRIYCDERSDWKPGAIDRLRKRTRTFHNYQEFSLGTAGNKNDALHIDWKEGSQTFIHWNCPKCQHSQPFRFGRKESVFFPTPRDRGGIIWPTDETTKPAGRWNWDAVKAATRYECEKCGELFHNSQKIELLKSWHPVDYNPAAPAHLKSIHWNAMYMPWADCDFGEIAVEFLKAVDAMKHGNIEPMKAFITETLGEPWEEIGDRPKESELKMQCGKHYGEPYDRGQKWIPKEGEEIATVITVDTQGAQGGFIKYAICQWKKNGDSRLVDYGRLRDYDDLRDLQEKHGTECVFLDARYNTSKVYAACVQYGWTPLMGDARDFFIQYVEKTPIRVPWKTTDVDPSLGKAGEGKMSLNLILFSDSTYKNRLLLYCARGRGPKWMLPDDIGNDFLEEMRGEERRTIKDSRGVEKEEWFKVGTNDYLDIMKMQQVVADAGGITVIGDVPASEKSDEPKPD